MKTDRCHFRGAQSYRCLLLDGHDGPHDLAQLDRYRRPIVVVDGAGRPVGPVWAVRCSSLSAAGKQCCYAASHDGYHCDKNGLATWGPP